jgi:phosphonate transport system substrate-binding protein
MLETREVKELFINRLSFLARKMVNRRAVLQSSMALGMMPSLTKAMPSSNQFHVGVMPTLSARIIATQYEPLQAFLTKKLESSVMLSTAADVANFYRNIQADNYEIVITAAHVARLIQTQLGFTPIAKFQPKVKCVLVIAKGSDSFLRTLNRKPQVVHSDPASLITFEAEIWLEKQGLKSGVDFELTRVRSAENIGMAIARGDAGAGVMSLNAFYAQPQEVQDRLQVAQLISEIPGFYIMAAQKLAPAIARKVTSYFDLFSDKSREGKLFEERTGFIVTTAVDDTELARMDVFQDKTRKLLT